MIIRSTVYTCESAWIKKTRLRCRLPRGQQVSHQKWTCGTQGRDDQKFKRPKTEVLLAFTKRIDVLQYWKKRKKNKEHSSPIEICFCITGFEQCKSDFQWPIQLQIYLIDWYGNVLCYVGIVDIIQRWYVRRSILSVHGSTHLNPGKQSEMKTINTQVNDNK